MTAKKTLILVAFLIAIVDVTANTSHARYLYIANQRSNQVSVVQTESGDVVEFGIAVGVRPSSVVVNPTGTRAYVANSGIIGNAALDTVSVIDTAKNTVVKTIDVGDRPVDLATSPDGSRVYVVNAGTAGIGGLSLSVIYVSDDSVTTLDLGGEGATSLGAVAIKPDGSRAYVTDPDGEKIWVIDTSGPIVDESIDLPDSVHEVAANPQDIVITPDGERLVVTDIGQFVDWPASANDWKGSVWVIETDNPINRASVETVQTGPFALSKAGVTVDGSRAYITGSRHGLNDDTISEVHISEERLVKTISVEQQGERNTSNPASLAMSPDGARLWAGNDSVSGTFIFSMDIDGGATHNTLLEPIYVLGQTPSAVALVPNRSPVAKLTVTPGAATEATRLDASASSDPDDTADRKDIVKYHWDFGDNYNLTGASATVDHYYRSAGTYTASVTAEDRAGNKGEARVFTGKTALQVPGDATDSRSFTVEAPSPTQQPTNTPSNSSPPVTGGDSPKSNDKPQLELKIRQPKNGKRYRSRKLKSILGTADGGSKIKVSYSLAKKAGKKCRLLTAKGKRRQKKLGSCSSPAWRRASGSDKWKVKLKPLLKTGSYILAVKATNSEGNSSQRRVEFKIK